MNEESRKGSWRRPKLLIPLIAAVAALAVVLALLFWPGGEEPAPSRVATIPDLKVDSTVVRAIDNQPFTFPSGEAISPALANKPVTLTFTDTEAVSPTFTLTTPGVGTDGNPARATGTTGFGSCIFTVTSSNIPGVTAGQTITVNVCSVNVQTGGVQATGQATTVQILLQLGLTPSQANQASVAIDPNTGVVTVNNVNTGVSVTLVVGY